MAAFQMPQRFPAPLPANFAGQINLDRYTGRLLYGTIFVNDVERAVDIRAVNISGLRTRSFVNEEEMLRQLWMEIRSCGRDSFHIHRKAGQEPIVSVGYEDVESAARCLAKDGKDWAGTRSHKDSPLKVRGRFFSRGVTGGWITVSPDMAARFRPAAADSLTVHRRWDNMGVQTDLSLPRAQYPDFDSILPFDQVEPPTDRQGVNDPTRRFASLQPVTSRVNGREYVNRSYRWDKRQSMTEYASQFYTRVLASEEGHVVREFRSWTRERFQPETRTMLEQVNEPNTTGPAIPWAHQATRPNGFARVVALTPIGLLEQAGVVDRIRRGDIDFVHDRMDPTLTEALLQHHERGRWARSHSVARAWWGVGFHPTSDSAPVQWLDIQW